MHMQGPDKVDAALMSTMLTLVMEQTQLLLVLFAHKCARAAAQLHAHQQARHAC